MEECKLSHAELTDLKDVDWMNVLWEYALPWVKYTIKDMIKHGKLDSFYAREDLLQEGNLAAGRAVQRWEPPKGSLGTWVCSCVRGELLDYLGAQSNNGMGSKNVRSKTYQLQDKHTRRLSVPDGEDQTNEVQVVDHTRRAISTLSGRERELAVALYQRGDTLEECAVRLGISESTVQRLQKSVLKKMTTFLQKKLHLL